MKRRNFIKAAAVVSTIPLFFRGQALHALGRNLFLNLLTGIRPDRKLVLLQLNGGNDGLNTLIPVDQYGNLSNARSNILIPENKILPLTALNGLHPSMGKVKELFLQEEVLFVQNVGYPNPNLSHFRSKDIITSASDADVVLNTGWIGRMLQDLNPDYPEGYPNQESPHPLALTIGSTNSPTCQGETGNLGTVIKNLNTSFQTGGGEGASFPESPFGNEMDFITTVMRQTEKYLGVIQEVSSRASNLSSHWPEAGQNKLADQLKIVANLIAGGLDTQVYIVSLGGFDTHSAQVDGGSTDTGKHANLLSDMSVAIHAFQDDLSLMNRGDEVIGLVYSEFGRRIKSNSSLGSDHGAAWPALLFGKKINPVLLGTNPVIPSSVGKKDNLPMQYDFRSVYGSVFEQWFEADTSLINKLLYKDFESIPLLKPETTTDGSFGVHARAGLPAIRNLYPNPAKHMLHLDFISESRKVSISIYTPEGRLVSKQKFAGLADGSNRLEINTSELSGGHYVLYLQSGQSKTSANFSVID